jgi:hypothetical protein
VENGFDREWQEILENIQDVVYLVTGQSGQTCKVTVIDVRYMSDYDYHLMLQTASPNTTLTAYIHDNVQTDVEVAVVSGLENRNPASFEEFCCGAMAAVSHLLCLNQLAKTELLRVCDWINETVFQVKLESDVLWVQSPDGKTWFSGSAKQVFK